jgi:hypothetical protein
VTRAVSRVLRVTESAGPPTSLRVAAAVIWLQAAALVGLAVTIVVKTITGDPHNVGGALVDALLALVAALVLAGCGRSLLRLQPSARTPVVVIELVALPVSYTLAFPAHRIGYGAPILISALVVLYLVFTPAARAALDREI